MTGFGMAEGPVGDGRLAVELRAVNHRHFAVQFRLPTALQRYEAELRARVRERIERGHLTLGARWTLEPPSSGAIRVDIERARAVAAALTELRDALGLTGEIDLAFVARQPDVLTVPEEEQADVDLGALLELVDRAVAGVVEMREREGEALVRDLERRLAGLEQGLAQVEARAPMRLAAERDRLRRAVRELLEGQSLDEGRLEQEIALLADKLDISEELARLRSHIAAVRTGVGAPGAVGRQLGFLGQEMLREVNTIGAKANDAVITHAVVAMKGEVEKFREQVENVE